GHPGTPTPGEPALGKPPAKIEGFRPEGHPGIRTTPPPPRVPSPPVGFEPPTPFIETSLTGLGVTGLAVVAAVGAWVWAITDIRRAYRGEPTLTDEALHFWTTGKLLSAPPHWVPDRP